MPEKKTTKKKNVKSKSTDAQSTPAPESTSVPETTLVTESVALTETNNSSTLENKYEEDFNNLRDHFELCIKNAKDGLTLLKKLEKMVNKDLKKKKKKAASGFAKPCKISKDLSKFLGIPNDELIARTDVTKKITSYIKQHQLFDPSNKRNIKPDNKLKSLLNYDGIKDNQITYFNLQKAMKHHFVV